MLMLLEPPLGLVKLPVVTLLMPLPELPDAAPMHTGQAFWPITMASCRVRCWAFFMPEQVALMW